MSMIGSEDCVVAGAVCAWDVSPAKTQATAAAGGAVTPARTSRRVGRWSSCNMVGDFRYSGEMNAIRLSRAFVVLLSFLGAAPTSAPTVKKEDLPRVPPTEPRDAIKTFK